MVKLLDDGSFVIPGEEKAHASLDALVTFHQQQPVRPHGDLLTQPCGQVSVGTPVGRSRPRGGQAPRLILFPRSPFSLLGFCHCCGPCPPPAPPLLVFLPCLTPAPQANFLQGFICGGITLADL